MAGLAPAFLLAAADRYCHPAPILPVCESIPLMVFTRHWKSTPVLPMFRA
jgi:hypothetical protein